MSLCYPPFFHSFVPPRCWNLRTGVCAMLFRGHFGTINCLDLHGNTLVSGAKDCRVKGERKGFNLQAFQCEALSDHLLQVTVFKCFVIPWRKETQQWGQTLRSVYLVWEYHRRITLLCTFLPFSCVPHLKFDRLQSLLVCRIFSVSSFLVSMCSICLNILPSQVISMEELLSPPSDC